MSDAELTTLVDQLLDADDPKVRRDAARRMGELRNPAAITYLVQAYTGDTDQGVRKAAERALLIYRRIEHERSGAGGVGSQGAITIGGRTFTAEQLSRARRILTIVLIVTVVGNVGLFLVRAIQTLANQPPAAPQQDFPTPRDELISRLQVRIDTMKTESQPLRKLFTNFQAELEQLNELPRECKNKLEATAVRVGALADIDIKTYPDIARVAKADGPLVIAEQKYLEVRGDYEKWCAIKDINALKGQVASRPGGAVYLVQRLDEALTKDLSTAQGLLDAAIRSPEATVGPPPTATPTITLTVTETPTPGPTQTAGAVSETPVGEPPTVTPVPGQQAAQATEAATAAPTTQPTAVAVAPPVPADFNAGFAALGRYQFEASYRYSGSYGNQSISGSLKLVAFHGVSPLTGEYTLTINETQPAQNFPSILKGRNLVPEIVFKTGNTVYTVVNGTLYTTGTTTRRPCEIAKINKSIQTTILDLASYQTSPPEGAKLEYMGEEDGLQHWTFPYEGTSADGLNQTGKVALFYSPTEQVIKRLTYSATATLKVGPATAHVDIASETKLIHTGVQVTLPTVDGLPLACRP